MKAKGLLPDEAYGFSEAHFDQVCVPLFHFVIQTQADIRTASPATERFVHLSFH